MNPDPTNPQKLRHQQVEQTAEQQSTSTQAGQQFDSVEELIRFDAGQTAPPEALAERLKSSLAEEPKRRGGWWRRFFGKSD